MLEAKRKKSLDLGNFDTLTSFCIILLKKKITCDVVKEVFQLDKEGTINE